ncbi:MAG TPA: hypothetical protein VGH94_00690 [Acidimicrobiales bacterium]|jgi:hypothetical protein
MEPSDDRLELPASRFFRYPVGLLAVAAAVPVVVGSLTPWFVLRVGSHDEPIVPIHDGGFGMFMLVAALGLAISGWSLAKVAGSRLAVLFLSLCVGAQAVYSEHFYSTQLGPSFESASNGFSARVGVGFYFAALGAVLGLTAALFAGRPLLGRAGTRSRAPQPVPIPGTPSGAG